MGNYSHTARLGEGRLMQDGSPKGSPGNAPAEPEIAATESQDVGRAPQPDTLDAVDAAAPSEPVGNVSPPEVNPSSAEEEVQKATPVKTAPAATVLGQPPLTSPESTDPAPGPIEQLGPAQEPVDGTVGEGNTARKRARSRRKSGTGRQPAAVADVPEPTTLVDLLIAMGRERNLEPTKRVVKGAKPTPALSQEHLDSVRTTIADDPVFAVPVAFIRAVLLSGPTKRGLEQALAILEECLLARHLERASDTNKATPDRASDTWLLGWLVNIDRDEEAKAPAAQMADSENLVKALVVLLAARGKIPSANIPAVLAKTDGKGPVNARTVKNPDELDRALDAMSLADVACRDPLSHRALVAAARHIGEARAHAKLVDAEKAALVQRCETAEERSRRLIEESSQSRAAAQALEKERDELQRALAQARADADRAKSTARELTRSMEEVEARAAEERERNEQRRLDDSNAYEALRALTSRNRRKDLELLVEAAAALEKDPPKPHVALDRVSLVVKAMEKEREALRTQDEGNAAGAAVN
jgi:hypothetical protein